jgi:hypothetical protein
MTTIKKTPKRFDLWFVKRRPQRVVSILGMHRSGTRCLTGTMQEAGLVLGKFSTFNEFNRKGNREN